MRIQLREREEALVLLARVDTECARIVSRQWSRVDRDKAKHLFAKILVELQEIKPL